MKTADIQIDGSQGEGGGQILRTSLALSLLTGKAFRIRNIRARRPKPGLQAQHLMSVRSAATIGQAEVTGDHRGSTEFHFQPGEIVPGRYHFSIGTAGATGLVLQTLYLPLMLRAIEPSVIVITGGTHVKASPCFHFLETTWRAFLQHLGLVAGLKMRRPGFYPRGGGVIEAQLQPADSVRPTHLRPAGSDRPLQITGISGVAGLPESIAERQARRATTRLKQEKLQCDIELETWEGGPGTMLGLWLQTPVAPLLFFGLGERGKPAERVADEAVDALLDHVAGDATAVDPHSADQIVLPLVLAPGPSEFRTSCVTQHLLTNIDVIRRFIDRPVVCEGDEGQPGLVRIT